MNLKQIHNWTKAAAFFAVITFLISSCEKPAGEGGKASVYGKIWVQEWNTSYTVLNGEYAGMDEDVYIIYGDDVNYGDKQTTNYNGEFEFKYLRKGKYKVFIYSRFRALNKSGDSTVVKEFEIKEPKEKVDLGQITIYKK